MNLYRNIDRTKVQFDFLVHYQGRFFYDDEIEKLGGKIYRLSVRDDNNFPKYIRDLNNFFREHTEYKVVHGHMESLGRFYFKAAKKYGVPVRIAHSHNSATEPTLKGKIKGILLKGYVKYANVFFACSDLAGKFMFGDRDFVVFKNAIEPKKFEYSDAVRAEKRNELELDGKYVIGHIGRFCTQKNHKFLIDVFAEVVKENPDAVLLLIGSGELEEEVKAYAAQLRISEQVRFLGNRTDVNALYQAMDVFVFPSIFEGLGIVAIEAQAAGLMTICSDVVPTEANISDYFVSLSLNQWAQEWAKEINKHRLGYERNHIGQIVADAGYDIHTSAKWLQEFYTKQHQENV
ncbi:MAG: glycosyltransferase family 1 protein [Ruminococcus sp.]|nr:glycosyltransferase family 1 protein [Ruminococcus sp.]